MTTPIRLSILAGWTRQLILCCFAAFLGAIPTAAQLAITEVQSAQSATPAIRGVDYWELTNFGDEPVSLIDCWFTDDAGFTPGAAKNLSALLGMNWIAPLESVIFASSRPNLLTTAAEFRQWWGDSNLPPNLRISVAPWGFG